MNYLNLKYILLCKKVSISSGENLFFQEAFLCFPVLWIKIRNVSLVVLF